MKSSLDHLQFPRKTWQQITKSAWNCAEELGIADSTSRIENLRPIHLSEESDTQFGTQVWCFELSRARPKNFPQFALHSHLMDENQGEKTETPARSTHYCVLVYSVEFGILELNQSKWFDSSEQRENWINRLIEPFNPRSQHIPRSTSFWVGCAVASIVVLASGWVLSLIRFLQPAG